MEAKLWKKIRAECTSHGLLSVSSTQQARCPGGEHSRAVGTHSSDTVALFLSQTLTLPEPSGEKTRSPPADSLLSGPRGCAPEQPTLIFSCQIWDVGCKLEAHRLFSLLWFGASGQSTYEVIRSSFLEFCLVILVPANRKAFFFLPCAFISLNTSQGGCSIHNFITIPNRYVLSYNNASLPILLITCSRLL